MITGPVRVGPLPPRVHVDPALTDVDVEWLNRHLEYVDRPTVRYARYLDLPWLPPQELIR